MATTSGALGVKASMGWQQTQAVTGFTAATQGPDSLLFTASPDAAVLTEVFATTGTLAAAATVTLNFYSITNAFNLAKTITKLAGFLIKATGATGQLKIEPGASDPLVWSLAGTTPSLTLDCGTGGCCFLLHNGTNFTVATGAKNLKLSNPGAATITYYVSALCGA